MNRDELIEGAARALYAAQDRADPFESLADLYAEGYYNDARIILDFVEPIIRADEIARHPSPAVEGGWREKPTNANNMIGTRWRHKKRGSEYVVVDGMAEVQVSEGRELTDYECVVVYKGTDGRHWVRPRAEFFDGRFEPLPTPPAGEKP